MEAIIKIDNQPPVLMWAQIKDQLPGFAKVAHLDALYQKKLHVAWRENETTYIHHDGAWGWNSTGRWISIKVIKDGGVVIHVIYHGNATLADYL